MLQAKNRAAMLLIRGNVILACVFAILFLLAIFNWLAPAPDSSIALRPLVAYSVPLFAVISVLLFVTANQMKFHSRYRWYSQVLALVAFGSFYAYRHYLLQ